MARKSTAAAAIEPTTVAGRRRALRGEPASGPGVKKVTIDLTKAGARDALKALYPRPTSATMLDSTPAIEAAALEYVKQRDLESLSKKAKEVAGNHLCAAIGSNTGIVGEGWKATWDMSNGNVDWSALAKAEGISDETIAKYRKPQSRGLDVKEVAEEA